MSVERYRSIEEMSAAPVRRAADFEQFLRHCQRFWALAPKTFPRGVFKFRSVEDADRFSATHHRPRDAEPR